MENQNNVDNLLLFYENTQCYKQKIENYTHLHKKSVDNVEKFTHIEKPLKIKACLNFKKMNSHCLHKVIHNLSTKCG